MKKELKMRYVYIVVEIIAGTNGGGISIAAVCATNEIAEKAKAEFESQYDHRYHIEEQEIHRKGSTRRRLGKRRLGKGGGR